MAEPLVKGAEIITVTIGEDPPVRLDKALVREVPEKASLSRSRLMKLISQGSVKLDGVHVTNPKTKVVMGQKYEIELGLAVELDTMPENISITVVYEDDDLIVIDKPMGMVVHPAPGSWTGTLVNALLYHCADSLSGVGGVKRPGIVHRIDKDTSGLLVVAKVDKAHHALAAQFADHSVNRHYLAVAHGAPNAADPRLRGIRGVDFETGGIVKIATHLARHKTDRQRQAVLFDHGRHAVTRVRVLEAFGTPEVAALVECWLETGRTHQIRAHMSYVGHALLGDETYGGRRVVAAKSVGDAVADTANHFPRQALHAASLGFLHPMTKKPMHFESDLPADMASLIEKLRSSKPPKAH